MNMLVKAVMASALMNVMAMSAVAGTMADGKHAASLSRHMIDSWYAQSVATLSKLPDANSLVTAATLASEAPLKMALLDRAVKADPAAADIAAMAQMTCASIRGCDAALRADRLRALDPGNALAWLPKLRTAHDRGDETQVTQLLQRMAQSLQFRIYQAQMTIRFEDALQAVPQNPEPQFQTTRGPNVARLETARFLTDIFASKPAFNGFQTCMPSAPQHAHRRTACQRIGVLLEAADGYIANRVGLTIDRFNAADATDYAHVVAKARQFDWRYSYYAGFIQAMHPDDYADFARSQQQLRSFSAAMDALLTQHGVPLDPPASWVDKTWQFGSRVHVER